jgi:hypothetical protein
VGGFIGISLNGSKEVLIDLQQTTHSYVVKTLQADCTNGLIKSFIHFNSITQLIKDQILGSLAYHSISEIKPRIESLLEGTYFDEMLPNSLLITQKESQFLQEGLKNFYTNPFNQQQAFTLAALLGMRKEEIIPFFNQDLDVLFDQLNGNPIKDKRMNDQQMISAMIRAINQYILFVIQDPLIVAAQRNFTTAFVEQYRAKLEKKDEYSLRMSQHKQILIDSLKISFQTYFKNNQSVVNLDELIELIDETKTKEIVDILMSNFKKLEEKLFAFPITNESLVLYVDLVAGIHFRFFNPFLAIEMLKPFQNPDEEIIRKNYQHLNFLLAEYYSLAVDCRFPSGMVMASKKIVHLIQHLFHNQIQTAKLKDSTLSDLVDLEPLVNRLKSP